MSEQITQSEERAKLLVDSICRNIADFGVSLLNDKGQVRSWNQGAEKILGYNRRSILGRPATGLFDNRNQATMLMVEADLKKYKDCHDLVFNNSRNKRKRLSLSLERIELGEFKGYLLVIAEKERSQIMNKTRSLSASISALLNNSERKALIGVNSRSEIILWNKSAAKLFNCDASSARGEKLKTFISTFCLEKLTSTGSKMSNSPVETFKSISCKTPDGQQLETDLLRIRSASGNSVFTIFSIPGSESNAREKQPIELEHEDLDELVSIFTHDLKNQLLGFKQIFNYLKEEKAGSLNDKQHKVIEAVKGSNDHLLSLIEKLSELKDSRTVRKHEYFDLHSIVKECVNSFHYAAVLGNFEISMTPEPPAAIVAGDPVALRQVISNLLHNAVKFTSEGGKIDVLAYDEEDHAVVEVRDMGPGIEPDCKQDIFQKNVSLSQVQVPEKYEKYARPGESEGYAGSGLGLYICKKIVSSHNGALSVQSMNNQGATFIVRLPKAGCRSQGPLA
ncbi:MAG: PAS domain-containing sensor histidine kinase [Candidatus Obscuribacterales bacterium]|nr:PAS domain-containing sensor histidine kinase [Cyanobacteria bacterium HKST-UBA01]MCB9468961.1 PAS domain-containing sensor histidine kinase [Candidatus Obscuribacterales bacterium]